MKRKTALLASSSAVLLGAALLALLPFGASNFARYDANERGYALVGDFSNNRFLPAESGDGIGISRTKLGNIVRWDYLDASSSAASWAILPRGGRLANLDPIHGLSAITFTFQNDDAAVSLRYGGSREYGSSRFFSARQDGKEIAFDFAGTAPNYLEFYAQSDTRISAISLSYSCADQYVDLALSSSDPLRGEVRGAGKRQIGTRATIEALPREGMAFEGWYEGGELVSKEPAFAVDIQKARSFEARFSGEIALRQTYSYGRYPQRVASQEETGILSASAPDRDGVYRHGNDAYVFLEAQPRHKNPPTFDDGTTIEAGKGYFFKLEPIAWKVLGKNEDGSYLLLTEKILDGSLYYENQNDRQVDGKTISPSHYGASTLRAFLNGYDGSAYGVANYAGRGLFDRFFSEEEARNIKVSEVDNSPDTTFHPSNKFTCENTNDRLFPLSYVDYENADYGFSTSDFTKQRCLGSDYANAIGVGLLDDWRTADYWMRSPNPSFGSQASQVFKNGMLGFAEVDMAGFGVRPAMNLLFS